MTRYVLRDVEAMPVGAAVRDVWEAGAAYEAYVGRWSRSVARELVAWLSVAPGGRWLDVGCGTGALAAAVVAGAAPAGVVAVDRSEGFVRHARASLASAPVGFAVGDAASLPLSSSAFDAVVSGLVLNFVKEPPAMVAELARVARPGGTVGVYVWDYAEGMQLMRCFWDAAKELDPGAAPLDEGARFQLCAPAPLRRLFEAAGLGSVATRAIEVETVFRDFDDCWSPFLGGQGPAPAYVMSLAEGRRSALRELMRERLPANEDGSIALTARAWAVKGLRAPAR